MSSAAIFSSCFNIVSNIPLLHSSPEKVVFQGINRIASRQKPRGNSCRTTADAEQLSWGELNWEKIPSLGQPARRSKDHGMESQFFSLTAVGVFLVHHAHVSLASEMLSIETTSKCCLKSKHSKQK